MFDDTREVIVKKEIVLREEDDGAFLFDPDTGRICYLNDLGIVIWKSCEESKTPDRLIDEISPGYPEIPKEQIKEDCLNFLDDLERLGFLQAETEG